MINNQWLFVFLILLNTIIGIGIQAYQQPTIYDDTLLITKINYQQEQQDTQTTDEGIWGGIKNRLLQIETTIGNGITMSLSVLNIFWDGIKPWGINPYQYTNPLEKMVATIILFTRMIITALASFQLYLILKNKAV